MNLVGPSLGILSGKSNEGIAEKLQGTYLVVLDVERFRKRPPVNEEPLVSLFVRHNTKSIARLLALVPYIYSLREGIARLLVLISLFP